MAACITVMALVPACTTPAAPGGGGSGTVAVTGVTVTAATTSVTLPNTVQATAVVLPAAAPQTVTWSSSNPSAGTVSSSGLVTPLLAGTVTITATSTADPTKSGSIQLAIVCPDPRLVTANIGSDSRWENWIPDPSCFDYVVQADLIFNGAALRIEPGTVVGFEEGLGMRVRGDAALDADGTAPEPIVLTGATDDWEFLAGTVADRGFWKGVSIEAPTHPENRIKYTTIEYTGGAGISNTQDASLMLVGGGTITLEHSVLRESAGYGLFLDRDVLLSGAGSNDMTRNALGPAWAYASEVDDVVRGNSTLVGNDVDEVAVYPTPIDGAHIWTRGVYRILQTSAREAFNVREWLTLDPGVTIRFEADMAMLVTGGALTAVGTSDAPVVLTGTERVPGHWRGLAFLDTDQPGNQLDHVIIEFAGSARIGAGPPANLVLVGGGTVAATEVEITNSLLQHGGSYGMFVRHPSRPTAFTGNTLTGNTEGAAYVDAPVVDDLLDGDFSGNIVDEVLVYIPAVGIEDSDTWRDLGATYVVRFGGAPNLRVTGSLTIDPGVDVLFEDGTGIDVFGGFLSAVGTEMNPITMKAKDAAWWGLGFLDGGGSFDYLTVSGAGSRTWSFVNHTGAVVLRTNDVANPPSASVTMTKDVSLSGGAFDIVFGQGDTFVTGCPTGDIYVPPPDQVGDHCRPG